jgi:glycosyltransferase involved in cell wall biosynthesis
MFSIIIPSLNNLNYLKLCIASIKKNSIFDHEIIIHVNVGDDGTINYLNLNKIKYTHTVVNSGICEGVNLASKLSSKEFILYAHDDFYFCPNWDKSLFDEIKKIGHNKFYLSGTMIETSGKISLNCGSTVENFNENKLLSKYKELDFKDFQGSTWAPHLVHKDLWNKIGGFSEEYFPGTGSDPDLNKKLWDEGVRIFKGLKNCMVYHFGSTVTRKNVNKSYNTESGSKGAKIFLLKWGISIKFFKKFYLKSNTPYDGILNEPKKNWLYLLNLIKCKILYLYYKVVF